VAYFHMAQSLGFMCSCHALCQRACDSALCTNPHRKSFFFLTSDSNISCLAQRNGEINLDSKVSVGNLTLT
jgi:hypothetical protein